MSLTSVIIVTHNSQSVIEHCLTSLRNQTVRPDSVVIVDSGSADPRYVQEVGGKGLWLSLLLHENVGFSRANNVGYQQVRQSSDYVLFLNPDAFPAPDTLEQAIRFLETNPDVGCVSCRLLVYDWGLQQATGKLDSTGVFRKWYGRWYDRGQGDLDDDRYSRQEEVPAACGAFLFCRKAMLEQISLADGDIFDPDFFLYKEDIELCLRIRKSPWRVVYLPFIHAYHCRGWQNRQQMSYRLRLTAAASELLLYRKHPSPYLLWALIKYILVRWFRV